MCFAEILSRITIDTYIQRARMFGDGNDIANKFNLTIPENLDLITIIKA